MTAVHLEAWGEQDLGLLERLVGDPLMMEHLGGAERPKQIADRQRRYEHSDSNQYKIVDDVTGQGIGWVGYWEREWLGEPVYEIGWSVLPAFQGRGVAGSAAAAAIDSARAQRSRQFLHAFPAVDNAPSNAICAKLGFTLLGSREFEYPKGHLMSSNDWQLDLFAG
ncbi:MAG TPA: GNAT family N-acetyltransferase [Solirubrobacteraceae bacterium]